MRPHVELIQEDDLIWHDGEFPHAVGGSAQRNLSYDEENGAASTRVRLEKGWRRPRGYHHAITEWYVLSGSVLVDGREHGKGTYWRAPRLMMVPEMRTETGAELLVYREAGDWGFTPSESSLEEAEDDWTLLSGDQMDWQAVATAGPAPGLFIKLLHRHPVTRAYSRLIWAKPGWTDHRLAHHPCSEEAYTLAGSMTYNFGDLEVGTYFYRPPWVKHGHFLSGEPDGCVWLIRSDGELVNLYTGHNVLIREEEALNYDPATQAPVVAGIPVRSRTAGEWSLDGQ